MVVPLCNSNNPLLLLLLFLYSYLCFSSSYFTLFLFVAVTLTFPCAIHGATLSQRKLTLQCTNHQEILQGSFISERITTLRRRFILSSFLSTCVFPTLSSYAKTKTKNPYDEKRLLQQNKRIQQENNAPEDFPNFIREGFEVKVVAPDNYTKRDSGLIYRDFEVGKGNLSLCRL
ncbi:hypothetical protein PIB30_040147 [Stylosanthes scabra]|uniref:Uncharacterized protein n=1 Tax=Stylosanthes scabra TaxID=79078 RepID=A0ABU6VF81_9FABA|nr:hypothetical protein [Stylosanthes scabra]